MFEMKPEQIITKPIPNHDGYFASSDGRIFTCWQRIGVVGGGNTFVKGSSMRELKQGTARNGYKKLVISCGNSKHKTRLVHHLILESFGKFRDEINNQVRHLDGNKSNNDISNLTWGTALQNSADALEHKVSPHGERNGRAKLTQKEAEHIRTCGFPLGTLMEMYPVSNVVICRIRRGVGYKSEWN